MKPERIQFAPWFSRWLASVPFVRKAYACESIDEAAHYVAHIHRVARFFETSQVKTSIDEDFVVEVKILPVESDSVCEAQFALGQRLDAALSYLQGAPETDPRPDVFS